MEPTLKCLTSWHHGSQKQLEGPTHTDYNDMVMIDMGKGLENGKDLIITSLSQMFLRAQLVERIRLVLFGISRIFFWSLKD